MIWKAVRPAARVAVTVVACSRARTAALISCAMLACPPPRARWPVTRLCLCRADGLGELMEILFGNRWPLWRSYRASPRWLSR